MMHEVSSMAGFALRGNDLIGEVIDMVSARVATAQCAGEVTIGGPERRDQRRQ
ncbi:hypothetical protein V4C53_44445 [Paraburkholderia azotifigens]|uniref:hypothetical protein n=1 Tax=Paraburkholderia azotifigens TaxID=2057004 RepID=UPI00317DBE3A